LEGATGSVEETVLSRVVGKGIASTRHNKVKVLSKPIGWEVERFPSSKGTGIIPAPALPTRGATSALVMGMRNQQDFQLPY
jgi:hypothetical protein